MLVVEKNFDNSAFEDAIRAVHSKDAGVIRVPNSIVTKDLGGSARLLQLLATWSRLKSGGATLKLHSVSISAPEFKKFATTPFGLASLIFCDKILTSKGEEVSRHEALKYSTDYVRTMHSGPLSDLRDYNKSSLPIICIDGARTLRRPSRLYAGETEEVRGKSDFSNLTRGCFETIKTIGGDSTASENYNDIGHLLHEAFLNTHEHAQEDAWGRPYTRSLRGISISFRDLNIERVKKSAEHFGSVGSYFASFSLSRSDLTQARFAEVSIFDSGPGLALNWLQKKRKLTSEIEQELRSEFGSFLLDEYEAVRSCLVKGATTKGRESRGVGMFRMMQVIKRTGGFLSIRSGRLSLAKHFGAPSNETVFGTDFDLVDLERESRPDKALPRVEGTVISALIPLNRG